MAKRFVTEFVINGDASGGVRAFNDTRNSADQLNNSLQTGTQRSAEYTQGIGSASQELQVLRRVAAPVAALLAGMFTVNTLKSSIDFADQVQKINLRIGASTEFLSEMNYVAELSGVRFSELSTALQRQTRRMAEAAQGGGPMVKTLQQLNLSADELSRLAPEDQFDRIAQALNGVANEGDRVAMAQKIWDSEGVKLLQIVNQGTAAIEMQREQARALGLTISNDTANAMAGFNDQITVLNFAAQGLAQTLLSEIVPGLTTTMQATNELMQDLGGAERVVDAVIDGSILLSGVLAGRVVGALGASAMATGKKIAADRTAAAQAALVAQQEQSTALAVARRAEAEQVAAVNSARISTQRAQAAQAEAAAKLREVQVNQQIMASERALETERLKAQISATGRQQSLARLADIRRTEMGLVAQSTAAQQALRTAEQQTAASTRALTAAKVDAARAAGVSNAALAASTAAATTASKAHTALAGAARASRLAMAPLGGPLGVAAAAATAFYLFRDSSDDVGVSLNQLQAPLDETIEKFQQLNRDQQQAELVRWGTRLAEEADKASEAFSRLRRDVIDEAFFNLPFSERFDFVDQLNEGFEEVKNGARSFDSLLQEVLERVGVDDQKVSSWRALAGVVADHTDNVETANERIGALEEVLNNVADAADSAGASVSNSAPSDQALDQWSKYNDQLRDAIANLEDPSLIGRTNRALDSMGIVDPVRRATTLMLEQRKAALEDEKKAQEEAARAAQRATAEAERNAQRQAQAAERNAQRQAQAAQQAAEAQAKALVGIQQEMTPLLADHAEYIERLGVLDKALADGTLTHEEYGDAVRWNAEQYQRAATGAEEYEKQTETLVSAYDRHNQKAQHLQTALEQINQRYRAGEIDGEQYTRMIGGIRDEMQQLALEADPAAQEMARAWEEASNRIDETFADAFTGAFDSFDDFTDQLLDGFKRLLGELAYQATLKPIVVQFTQQMGGGGLNLGSLGGLGKTIGGLFGGGSAAASAGGLYSGASTGLAAGGLYGNAVTGGVASTGIMSSITAGVSAAMPWIAGGLAIDSLLGGGITKAIGGLFGRKKTPFYGEFGTGDGVREYPQESAFGRIGFTRAQRLERGTSAGNQDWAGELAATSAALDNMLATLARSPAEFDAMTAAAENFRVGSGSVARLIQGQLVDRSLKILESAGHDVTAAWGNLAADELAARIEMASGAMSVMEQASERLNIGFDATSATALLASTNIAEITGGIDQLASLNSSYYQAFFSDAERAANLQADVTQSLAAMNMQLPQTRDGYRRLVEAQDLHTEAGQRNYAQLLQLAPAFAELVPEMEDVASGVRDFAAELSTARDAITDSESDVRSAYKAFESQSFKQQITLMEMAGDSAAALALQRERELLSIDPLLHETQRVIWAIEDETQAKQDAIGAAKNYATSLAQVSDQLASTFNGISAWVDQQNATGGTPGANLGEARAQLDRQLELARSGDRNALQSITQYADRALQANDAYNASGPAGQAIRDDVLAALEELPDQISAEEYIAEEIKQALREQTEGISSQLGDVLRGDNPSNIAGNLAGFFTTLAGGIDGVLTREQLAIVMSGKATDAELQAIMRAVDLNGDGVMDGLESVIIQSLPTDSVLGTVLRNKMSELDKNQLTHAQIRTALSPIATDAEINRLIREVDVNGDGIITRQELANARISGLAGGIAKSLNPAFDMLDSNLDGKLTFAELSRGLDGMATDEQLKAIARAVDLSSDGVVSGLESVIVKGMPTDAILGTLLRNKMSELDKNQLTHAQIRNALSPLASDAEIKRLIHEVDVNGDGIISAQELSSARIGGLSRGIVGGLWPAFDMLDANLNGKLTYNELRKGLSGIATDAQIRALMRSMDLNGDGIMSHLESVVIKDMPTDVLLETALSNKLDELGTDQLTEAQIRKALSPIATDKEIDRLISLSSKTGSTQISWLKWQDGKLKAINSESRYTNNRLAGLAGGIGSSLSPMFKSIDTSLDGLIDYKEFSKAFSGMATDKELRNIFGKLDEDGSGTIDRLEALARTGEGTEDNTKSLEERAYDQLASLNGLVGEMARTTDQFVGLNSNVVSLRDAINALGVAQNEAARIEREQAVRGVEDEARVVTDRLSSTWDARSGTLSEIKSIENWGKGKDIDRLRPIAEQGTGEGVSGWHQNNDGKYRNWRGWEPYFNELTGQLRGSDLEDMTDNQFSSWLSSEKKKHDPGTWGAEYIEVLARRIRAQELVAKADRDNAHKVNLYNQLPGHTGAIDVYQQQLADLRKEYAELAGSAAPFAKGGVFTNSIVSTPTYFDMGLMGEEDPEAIMPLSRAPGGRLGVDASGLMRIPDGPLELPMPNVPLPQFPALGSNDVLQVLQDVKRELQESRKENKRLQEENNRHAAAAVAVQQAGFNGQISEQKKGNAALGTMASKARLEGSR